MLPAVRQNSGEFYLSVRLLQRTAHINFLTFVVHKVV